jgi:hypothetical protein
MVMEYLDRMTLKHRIAGQARSLAAYEDFLTL